MNIILCSVSDIEYNDSIVPGLVHFGLKARLRNQPFRHARYMIEDQYIELLDENSEHCEDIRADNNTGRSRKYQCVKKLQAYMKQGDWLMSVSLSDLGENAEEAGTLYFSFLAKGVQLFFFDCNYVDTELHHLSPSVTKELKEMLQVNIRNYYQLQKENQPGLTNSEMNEFSCVKNAKKK